MSEDALELQMLIQAAQRGDEHAFETLLSRFESPIFRCVYAILGNRTDAEDVTQEVFIKLWRTLPHYRFQSAFLTYLTKIAHNTAMDFLRANKRRREMTTSLYITEDNGEQTPLPIADPDRQSDPVQGYLDAEKSAMLHDALLQLPPDARELITLRAVCGHSYREIAAILSLTEGTVKSRLHRAKKILIKILEHGNFFE
ncbi:MAG: RNA polymerase sigma factor [Clostridia bacterium]|nr:RNA polymerase sigma factor [Clostridia bacterium]